MVASIALVAQQHLLAVPLPAADPALRVQDGAGPRDAPLQGGQVEEDLQSGSGSQQSARAQRLTWHMKTGSVLRFHFRLGTRQLL